MRMTLTEAQERIEEIARECYVEVEERTRAGVHKAMKNHETEIKEIPYTQTKLKVYLHVANMLGMPCK